MKKLLFSLMLLLGAFSAAKADEGCVLVLTVNPQVTAKYGVYIDISPKDPTRPFVALIPGTPYNYAFENGDVVNIIVDQSVTPCGSVSGIDWGFVQWDSCGNIGPEVQLILPGTYISAIYDAAISCQCPLPGNGFLILQTGKGQQCSPQPAPKPQPNQPRQL